MVGPSNQSSLRRLIIVSVRERVEDALDSRLGPSGWADSDDVLTFSAFVARLSDWGVRHAPREAWWNRARPASAAELVTIRYGLVEKVAARAPRALAALMRSRGFGQLLARFFSDCIEGLVAPDELARFVADEAADVPRLVALSELFTAYRSHLREARLLDPADRARVAHDLLADDLALPPWLARAAHIEVRHVTSWTALRLSLVLRVASRLADCHGEPERVRLVLPYSHSGYRSFHHLEGVLRDLENRHDAPVEVVFDALEESRPDGPAAVAARLFDESPQPTDAAGCVQVHATPTRSQELRAVARHVRRLVDEGALPDDIAVGLRQPHRDAEDVARALARYDVPCERHRDRTLVEAAPVARLADMLAAVSEGLPREAMERILAGAFGPANAGDASAGDLAAMVRLLRASGVRDLVTGADHGRNGYEVRLTAHLERLRPEPPAKDREVSSTWRARQHEYARQAEHVEAILTLLRPLLAMQDPRPLREWALGMRPLLAALPEAVDVARAADSLTARVVRARIDEMRGLAALQQLLCELEAAPGADTLRLTTSGFRAMLLEAVAQVTLDDRGVGGGGVRIVSVDRVAGGCYAHVFLPFVNEGQFPAPSRTDPLFRDGERWAFNRWRQGRTPDPLRWRAFRLEEPTSEDERLPVRRSEEVLRFCLALAAARDGATVSYHTGDGAGRPVLPSVLVDALSRLRDSNDEPAVIATFEPLEVLPSPERVVSLSERRLVAAQRAALQADGPASPAWRELVETGAPAGDQPVALRRAQIELARLHLFDAVRRNIDVRAAAPQLDPTLLPYLGYLTRNGSESWFGAEQVVTSANQPVSIYPLERYGQCPARYFLRDIARIEAPDEPGEQMSAMARGRVLHRAIERFYAALADTGFDGIGALHGPDAPAVKRLIVESVDAAADDLLANVHLGHPRLLALDRRRFAETLIEAFLTATSPRKRRIHLPEGLPWVQEWSFGQAGEPPVAVDLGEGLGTIYVRGRIDRIDRTADGEVWITDYKSGRLKYPRQHLSDAALHRQSFQLSLYAAAVRQSFPALAEVPLAVQYFSLRDGRSVRLDWETLEPRLVVPSPPEPTTPLEPRAAAPSEAQTVSPQGDLFAAQGDLFAPRPAIAEPVPQHPAEPARLEAAAEREYKTLIEGLRDVVGGLQRGVFVAATRGCGLCQLADCCRVSRALYERETP